MTPGNDSPRESLSSPDEPVDENLPGEYLADELVDPGEYEVASDETEAEELTDEASSTDIDDPEQLAVAQTAADRARSSRPKRRVAEGAAASSSGRSASATTTAQRTTPVRFVEESVGELRKVVWPTWPQVQQLFWAVLVLVLFVIAFVGVLDLGFGWGLLRLFG